MQSRRSLRIGIINVLYSYELMAKPLDANEIFENEKELSNEQFNQIETISKNYNFYQKTIERFLKVTWQWERISPLVRAILLNATNEFFTLEPKIVINEAVEITKIFFSNENNIYKMVNAILQNIYKFFVANEVLIRKSEKINEK